MSYYIKIPNQGIQRLNNRRKLKLIAIYGLIRSQIKDNTNTASYPEKDLAEMCGVDVRSIITYIQELQSMGLMRIIGKKKGEYPYPYNIYEFDHLEDDFSMITPNLLFDPNLDIEYKGLLILLKSHCHEGTNHMNYPSNEEVANELKIGKEKLSNMVGVLEALKYVKRIGYSLIIIDPNILMFYDTRDPYNIGYKIIYDFCLSKGVVPPIKGESRNENLCQILAMFPPELLMEELPKRFKKLPPIISLDYFCQGLRNTHKSNKQKLQPQIGYVM